jgi:hypothetical protein
MRWGAKSSCVCYSAFSGFHTPMTGLCREQQTPAYTASGKAPDSHRIPLSQRLPDRSLDAGNDAAYVIFEGIAIQIILLHRRYLKQRPTFYPPALCVPKLSNLSKNKDSPNFHIEILGATSFLKMLTPRCAAECFKLFYFILSVPSTVVNRYLRRRRSPFPFSLVC